MIDVHAVNNKKTKKTKKVYRIIDSYNRKEKND